MVQYSIQYAESAEFDLIDVMHYIAVELNEPEAALRLTDTIDASIGSLSSMPHRCTLVDDERLATLGYRKLNIKNYLAFFTIDEETHTVNVERILYARRDWLNIL